MKNLQSYLDYIKKQQHKKCFKVRPYNNIQNRIYIMSSSHDTPYQYIAKWLTEHAEHPGIKQ